MWREGNVGVTPSRAECAGVPLRKMPPPLLTRILCLRAHQTGRCLLTFCGCHTIRFERLAEAILELSEERRSLLLQTAAILYMHSITGPLFSFDCINLSFSHAVSSHLGATPRKPSASLQRWLSCTCHIRRSLSFAG